MEQTNIALRGAKKLIKLEVLQGCLAVAGLTCQPRLDRRCHHPVVKGSYDGDTGARWPYGT